MEPSAGSWCGATEVCFRLRDPDHRLTSVRLESGVVHGDLSYREDTRSWELLLPRPPAHRIEYRLALGHPDGSSETGDHSVLCCPGYAEPEWVHLPAAGGQWRDLYLPLPAVHGELAARIWSPATPTDRVLVAHDGPDFHRYGELGHYTAAMIEAGRVPPYHLVLLPAGDRLEWYSANPAYARALAHDVLPALAAELGTDRPVVGAGASLGALAMLHAQRRHPEAFAGLLLHSGSFFRPRHDRQESGFRRYLRIVRFTGRVVRDREGPAVPIAMTCGTVEENLANNREMARALTDQGYAVDFAEVPDAHNWTAWRDALDPHLTALLQKVFN
ncbi:alpha/beta hydrolase [Nucisporomicrobium flavum]|uniref:alpha/beta hydrolase n=1 Tax=Nucisporomicrobium flavum TaxID=2785915 RepID=UPI0018F4645E|nr:alpha/beta hydrolase-fold protein [Nucisporomicrobium flavum]